MLQHKMTAYTQCCHNLTTCVCSLSFSIKNRTLSSRTVLALSPLAILLRCYGTNCVSTSAAASISNHKLTLDVPSHCITADILLVMQNDQQFPFVWQGDQHCGYRRVKPYLSKMREKKECLQLKEITCSFLLNELSCLGVFTVISLAILQFIATHVWLPQLMLFKSSEKYLEKCSCRKEEVQTSRNWQHDNPPV